MCIPNNTMAKSKDTHIQTCAYTCTHMCEHIYAYKHIYLLLLIPMLESKGVFFCWMRGFEPQTPNRLSDGGSNTHTRTHAHTHTHIYIYMHLHIQELLKHIDSNINRYWSVSLFTITMIQCRHNDRRGISYHQPHDCLLNRLFTHRWKKTS